METARLALLETAKCLTPIIASPCDSCMENVGNRVPLGWTIPTPIRRAQLLVSLHKTFAKKTPSRGSSWSLCPCPSLSSTRYTLLVRHKRSTVGPYRRYPLVGWLLVGVPKSLEKRHQLGREHMLRAFMITPQRSP
jgi:hypothetical protein